MSKNKRVTCQSGVTGYQCKLQDNYADFEQFEHYAETYGLHGRLGYAEPQAAWDANPTIQGSTVPSDFRKIVVDGEPVSDGLVLLFQYEIDNEHDEESGQSRSGSSSPGGDSPATLGSVLDSVLQGLELPCYNMDTLQDQVEALIDVHGRDAEVRQFLLN